MPYMTGTIAENPATGGGAVYVPPNVTAQGTGNSNVVYGQTTQIPDGTNLPSAPAGSLLVVTAGTAVAGTGGANVQVVTITPA